MWNNLPSVLEVFPWPFYITIDDSWLFFYIFGEVVLLLSFLASLYYRVFPKVIPEYRYSKTWAHACNAADSLHFHFMALFRQENQKLKELVTGGASAATAGSSSAPADDEAAEAKEEPMKEQSPAVRLKMDVSTPQKVGKIIRYNKLLLGVF